MNNEELAKILMASLYNKDIIDDETWNMTHLKQMWRDMAKRLNEHLFISKMHKTDKEKPHMYNEECLYICPVCQCAEFNNWGLDIEDMNCNCRDSKENHKIYPFWLDMKFDKEEEEPK